MSQKDEQVFLIWKWNKLINLKIIITAIGLNSKIVETKITLTYKVKCCQLHIWTQIILCFQILKFWKNKSWKFNSLPTTPFNFTNLNQRAVMVAKRKHRVYKKIVSPALPLVLMMLFQTMMLMILEWSKNLFKYHKTDKYFWNSQISQIPFTKFK